MTGIAEYCEGMSVNIKEIDGHTVIQAFNEAGFNQTQVNLVDVLMYVYATDPDLWYSIPDKALKELAGLDEHTIKASHE